MDPPNFDDLPSMSEIVRQQQQPLRDEIIRRQEETAKTWVSIFIGKDEITPDQSTFLLSAAHEETLSNFKPLGWYVVIKIRKHWWQLWKPKTKGVWNVFSDS